MKNEWLARFFVEHSGFVLTLSFSHAPLPEDAREVAQQVYVELLEEDKIRDDVDELKNHLRVLVRRVADRYRRAQKHRRSEVQERVGRYLAAITESNVHRYDYDEEMVALKSCLDLLPEKSRELIESYYFRNEPPASIGRRLEKSVEAVYKTIQRIRAKLLQCITSHTKRRSGHA